MKLIPDGSVDAIITDPPYNIAKDSNFTSMGRAGIDFGDWDKGFDLFSYIDMLPRICSKNANVLIFNDWKNLGQIARYAESKGFNIKDMVRWEKSNPMPRNRDRRFIVDYEVAVWLTMPKAKWVFNRQAENYDRPLFRGSLVGQSEKTEHTTQKPVWLMEQILLTLTNPGQVIFDPFMGSGSTGVAAVNTGRRFIGIEMDDKYFEIAEQRINENNLF